MATRRPKINVKRISSRAAKGYSYVRPNPGVRAIAAINGRGSYVARKTPSARSEMVGLSTSQRRARAKSAVRNATRRTVRRVVKKNTTNRGTAMRRKIRRRVRRNSWFGENERHATAARLGWTRGRKKGTRPPKVVRRKKAKATTKKKVVRRRKPKAAATTAPKKRVVRRKRAKKMVSNRRRRVVRNKRRSPARRRKVTRNTRSRRLPARRRVRRNSRRRTEMSRLFKRNGAMAWVQTGGFITAGFIGHKLFSNFLKNLMVSNLFTAAADASTDAQADGTAPAAGLGFLPASMAPYAGTISGAIAAAAGVYLVTKTVKNAQTRQLVAGGMVASFLQTLIVELLKKQAPKYADSLSGLGSSNANAVRLSAMYGMGASIEPMYAPIGEYFSSGVNGLGLPSYEAQAGMGEYFSSGVNGVGEYFSSGVNGLGEYGMNPDMMQAAAGYGALDAGSNSNHLDPTSNLDRELSIAEAAAGVGSLGPMQAAAGLGNVGIVGASQTWIPGESDPQIWAGVRPVNRSQMSTAMVSAGSLQSGGSQGIFG